MDLPVASPLEERLKTNDQIPEMIENDGEYSASRPKCKFRQVVLKNYKKSAIKHSIAKLSLLNS